MRRADLRGFVVFSFAFLAAVVCAAPKAWSASDGDPKSDDVKKADASLNKIDVGFFLLLDKKQPEVTPEQALNKIDVGFFLLLDKKDTHPAKEVELGRQLFFDPRLSANKVMSCSTCHNPSLAWSDGLPRARGLNGQQLLRNTPTLLNVHDYQQRFFWDGRAASLEEATLTAIQSRLEMNRDLKGLVVDLNRVPDYARQFAELYGSAGITPENVAKALSVFVRSEVQPGESAFDRFRADRTAMNPSQVRGLELFTGKARCIKCHTGPAFTDAAFHNSGLKPIPGVEDPGRYGVNPVSGAWRAFRTVALRDVGLTAPYMHDGSLATLRDVVEFYNRGGDIAEGRDPLIKPLELSESEKNDLVAFLNALSGPQKPVAAPVLPREVAPPSVEQALAWNQQRLKMIDYDLSKKDRDAVYANAVAIRDNADYLGQRSTGACAGALVRRAWDLSHAADSSADWSELRSVYGRLKEENASCAGILSGSAPVTASASAVQGSFVSYRSAARCDSGFSMDALMKGVNQGKLAGSDLQKLEADAGESLSAYYQFRAFQAQDPEVCTQLKGLQKTSFGVTRTAEWGCREWYYDLSTAQAMMTRSAEIEKRCRRSHHHDYPEVPLEDGAEICGIIAGNIDHPDVLCGKLIPRFMGPENRQACVNEFKRYSSESYIGDTQNGAPDMMYSRYAGLDAYAKAYRAKDAGLCGGSDTCLAMMGKGDAVIAKYSQKVKDSLCAPGESRQASAAHPDALASDVQPYSAP